MDIFLQNQLLRDFVQVIKQLGFSFFNGSFLAALNRVKTLSMCKATLAVALELTRVGCYMNTTWPNWYIINFVTTWQVHLKYHVTIEQIFWSCVIGYIWMAYTWIVYEPESWRWAEIFWVSSFLWKFRRMFYETQVSWKCQVGAFTNHLVLKSGFFNPPQRGLRMPPNHKKCKELENKIFHLAIV